MSGHRDISAPFQSKQPAEPTPVAAPQGTAAQAVSQKDYIDYTNSTFIPLEPVAALTLEKYCGPTPESNWVIPDRLLVGAYPASQSDVETFELLISILKLKISTFVCLQQEYRTHGITEAMWRSGHALRPYFEDVKLIIKNKSMFKSLSQHPGIVDSQNLDFVHFPIRDCSISDDAAVLKLSQSLVARLDKGERLYLHCWGGHGRTGTVVCIMLHLMYGMTANEAFSYCQRAHDLRQCPVNVGSPQTETQRDQVRRVVAALIQHRRAQREAPPPVLAGPPTGAVAAQQAVVKKQASLKDVAGIMQGTDRMAIDPAAPAPSQPSGPAPRNNIAARTAGLQVTVDGSAPLLGMVASPPSTPPASASGKRGGRNISYTVAADQSGAVKQPSPPKPQAPQPAQPPGEQPEEAHTVDMAEPAAAAPSAGGSSLPPVRRVGSASGSRPASPSPLTTQRSAHKIELHPHVVNLPQDGPAAAEPEPKEQELLKSIPPDLVEGKAVVPHVGLYPMVRMPTERMKNDLDLASPPGSRDGRRRGSRSAVPSLSTVSDAMEISQEDSASSRRMSAGTIIAHNIIMNATKDPSPKSVSTVPVKTPPTESADSSSKPGQGGPISRTGSNTSDGHTSNSAASIGQADEDNIQDFGEAGAFAKHGGAVVESAGGDEGSPGDDSAMDIDTDSAVRPASPAAAAKAPVLSSGASTFMGFHRR